MLRLLRIRTTPTEHEEKTTWLELFFDLVYVAILVVLGDRLSHNLTSQGVIEFALLFIPIWLSWLEPVFYSRRFPTDDIGHRLLTVLYMGAMVSLAFELYDVTGETATSFLLAYAATKAILALMYARAWRLHPEYRSFAGANAGVFAILAVLWAAIALLEPFAYSWWAIATALGLLSPFILPRILRQAGLSEKDLPPVKAHYVLDRFGELTIIVLGEFFLKAALGAAERESHRLTTFYGLALLTVSVGLWWLYFDHLEHSSLDADRTRRRVWIDLHYPLLAAIAAYGVAGTKVLALAPGEALAGEKRLLLAGALAIALLAGAGLERAAPEREEPLARKPQTWVRVAGAAVLAVLAFLGGGLSAPLLVASIALVFAVLVAVDVYARTRTRSASPAGSAGGTSDV
jgi:low temperature requirement protein LtrA